MEIFKALGFDDAFIDEMYEEGNFGGMDPKETAECRRLKDWGFLWREDQAKNPEL